MKLNVVIETDRCILCLLNKNDIGEATELFVNPDVRKYLGGIISRDEAVKRLNKWIEADDSLYFCVRLKNSGEFTGIVDISPHHNPVNKELSYQFLPNMWGNGYAYEVINTVIQFCFNTLGINYLVSETQTTNVRSCRLLKKLGYELSEKINRFGSEQSLYELRLL